MKNRDKREQKELFGIELSCLCDKKNPLYQMSEQINWKHFEEVFGTHYSDGTGRPAKPIRLMVGLHYLKSLYNESDEDLVRKWTENPYWQYFCGMEYFQHELPCDPTSLIKWRKRIGEEGMEKLIAETLFLASRSGYLKESDYVNVNVDTTVQEKAISFPTDAKLCHKMRIKLVSASVSRGIKLRQSYTRKGKESFLMQSRYSHAKQMKRARKELKKLRIQLGRVIRDIRRKCETPDEELLNLLSTADRIYEQKKDDKHKIYSIHAPEVECISKGKAHKKYEFGCKVSVVTTSKNSWVVGVESLHGNPYDGHTLKRSIEQMERITGTRPKRAFVDKGYKGKENHPEDVEVFLSGRKGLGNQLKKLLKRRSAIEPIIGHMKTEHGMGRNYLHGKEGDKINSLLAGAGKNLRKLMIAFLCFIFNGLKYVQFMLKSNIFDYKLLYYNF